ncbi:MAG TPA: hypothetical protein VGR16_07460 [Thermomicrobiales bacterium]|nr:hypothetical protein [Thermomicrobiales bacterium]
MPADCLWEPARDKKVRRGKDALGQAMEIVPAAIPGKSNGERPVLDWPDAAEVIAEWVVGWMLA